MILEILASPKPTKVDYINDPLNETFLVNQILDSKTEGNLTPNLHLDYDETPQTLKNPSLPSDSKLIKIPPKEFNLIDGVVKSLVFQLTIIGECNRVPEHPHPMLLQTKINNCSP